MSFRVGSTNCEKGGQLFTADKVLVKRELQWQFFLGLRHRSRQAQQAHQIQQKCQAIKLGTTSLKPTTKVVIAGWGPESQSEDKSMTLRTAKVTVYDWKKCEATYSSKLTQRLMCTYDTNVGPCASDFGDPLVYKNAVYGLFAGGYKCLTDPVLHVNVPVLVDWVKNAIKE
ncbi:trypsin theta-like [Homalodisca vitripennis]|uniref:trypsin theta-like n=1 Tax=Homalodisca vitripennis TaxID=197043 RepID=UPI001EEB85BD|nr:trypsin theta-like [Homalodisca vitripennis]